MEPNGVINVKDAGLLCKRLYGEQRGKHLTLKQRHIAKHRSRRANRSLCERAKTPERPQSLVAGRITSEGRIGLADIDSQTPQAGDVLAHAESCAGDRRPARKCRDL